MATKTTAKTVSTAQAKSDLALTSVTGTYTVSATNTIAAADVLQMVKVPAGATIQEVILSCSDLDTNGTPTLAMVVGDGTTTDRFIITSGTIGRTAAGLVRMDNHAGHGYQYTAADTIDVVISAVATAATTGTIVLTVVYSLDA